MRPKAITYSDGERLRVRRSKVIEHTRCGKQGYTSRKIALGRAAVEARESGEDIRAYKCTAGCHLYHLGHPPGSRVA